MQGGVLVISGELDVSTGPALARRLGAERSVRVVDLSAVTFIDAAGLRWLREGLGRARHRVIIRGISDEIHRLLEIAGLDDIDLTPHVAQMAIGHFRRGFPYHGRSRAPQDHIVGGRSATERSIPHQASAVLTAAWARRARGRRARRPDP